MQRGQAEFDFKEYDEYWNSAEKKDIRARQYFQVEPLSVSYDFGVEEHRP